MQPCAVCGGVVVDATGYCVQCGTFRGVPAPPPPGPPLGPPLPAAPGSLPPGPVYQASVPPAYIGPTSGPPGYPTSPAYYAGPAPMPAPGPVAPKPRSPFVIPLVALSATLAILVVAIVVVVLVRSASDPSDPVAGPSSEASTDPGVDSCVVGRWRVTSHEERVAIDSVGNVTFTGGDGTEIRLNADGTGVTDYGEGTEFEGTVSGRTVTLVLSGTVSFRFQTANGTVSFSDTTSEAEGVVKVDGDEIGREPFEASDDPAKYTCSDTELTESTNLYEIVMARVT